MNLKMEYSSFLSLVLLILFQILCVESLFIPTLPWILPSLKSEFNLEFKYKKWVGPAKSAPFGSLTFLAIFELTYALPIPYPDP